MGYFNTLEVETVLSMLAVIDNPMQDIPLAAVLKSPVVGMSDRELATMMADYRSCADKGQDRGIYAAAVRWERLNGFFEKLEQFRLLASYLPIHELIYRLYEETGYYDYVSVMPAGETRRANLDMLVEKASEYEKTSYKGLFHFIRYIENLKKYNSDFGEASTVGEEDNTVRIMSIHKSKGLEFPVVFLAGMGKKFNRQDVYGKVLIDPELGIAADYLGCRASGENFYDQEKRTATEDGAGQSRRGITCALCCHDKGKGKADHDRNRPKPREDSGKVQPDSACGRTDSLYHSFRCGLLSGLDPYVYRPNRKPDWEFW